MRGINKLLILCMFVVLTACVDSERDMENYVTEVKQNAKGKLEPVPPPKEIKNFDYGAESLRSPFVLTGGTYIGTQQPLTGPNGEIIKQQPKPDLDRPREYLEQFPLTSITMVGTLSKPRMNWGLVKDENGMIHAVKVGDYMGLNSGKIYAITQDQIKLNEIVPNGAGGWMESRAAISLVQAPPDVAEPPPSQGGAPGMPAAPGQNNSQTGTTKPPPAQGQPTTPGQAPGSIGRKGAT